MRVSINLKVFLACLLLWPANIFAQVFNNQQLINSDMAINPANTGNHKYEWRLYNYYKHSGTIGNNGFNSFFLGGEYQIHLFPSKVSLGGYFVSEDISNSPVQINKLYVSSSYHLPIGNHVLHLGLQPGIINYGIDQTGLTFPDQYDRATGGFNSQLPSSEILNFEGKTLPNLNFGAAYSYRKSRYHLETGLALFNLIPGEPPIAYKDAGIRANLHAKASLLSAQQIISPYAFLAYLPSGSQAMLGAYYSYFIPGKKFQFESLIAGAEIGFKGDGNPQHFALSAGLQWSKIMAVFKYQYPFSTAGNTSPNFNSFQLSLVFNGFNASLDRFVHPCNLF